MATLYFRKPFIIFSSRKVKVTDEHQRLQYYCGKYYDSRKELLKLARTENVRLFDKDNHILADAKQTEQARDQWKIVYGEHQEQVATMTNTSTMNTNMRLTIRYNGNEAVMKSDKGRKTFVLEAQGDVLATMKIQGLSLTHHEVTYDPATLDMAEELLVAAFYTFSLKHVRP